MLQAVVAWSIRNRVVVVVLAVLLLAGGTNGTACTSALENCNVGVSIPKNLKRTYWYKK